MVTIRLLLISLIALWCGSSLAADVTATGWTCAETAPASITIDSGSNRKLAYIINQEINTARLVTLTSVGGQSPDETLSYEEASATADHWYDYYIFNESTIAAMSGTTVVESGTATVEIRCWAVIDDTDQTALSALTGTNYTAGATTIDCTTTSSSGDYVVVTSITQFLRDYSSWDTLTEFNDTDTSAQTHGGGAGNGGDNTTTVTVSSSVEMTCASLVFPNASTTSLLLRRRR